MPCMCEVLDSIPDGQEKEKIIKLMSINELKRIDLMYWGKKTKNKEPGK